MGWSRPSLALMRVDVGVGRAVAEHGAGRIAGQQPHEDEDHHQDQDEGGDDLQQP